MDNKSKTIIVADQTFSIIQLEPWPRLAFIADLQKEFLLPLLKNAGTDDPAALFLGGEGGELDVMALIGAFSGAIDGARLEKWVRRILMEGMVVYTRADGQRAKLSFGELNKSFNHPAQIIMLLKEAIAWNLADFKELVAQFSPRTTGAVKEA